ncbi:hypothetical protein ABZP36_024069 [Zizania latifolia]
MEDLGMDPDEALADAVDVLTLQGADLSGIIKRVPGDAAAAEVSPVMRVLDELKASARAIAGGSSVDDLDTFTSLLDELRQVCAGEGLENAAVSVRNGVVEALIGLCSSTGIKEERPHLASGLNALSSLLRDVGSTEKFRQSEGPQVVMGILKGGSESSDILESGFRVVASASAGNEVVKECFMDLKVDELFLQVMGEKSNSNVQSLYDAIRVILTPDDNRVVASQVYGYSRRFAEIGIAEVLVSALREKVAASSLPSACAA